mmetsp:Transcript_65756/g.109246  ORF Transcript_65756/g.109246 Transcript_65756/m.109246 type:complete len:318 (-) Transcript_65756:312-1265(-)
MQKAEETAAEAEAHRRRRLGFEGKGSIVELQLIERLAKQLVLCRFNGEQPTVDDGCGLAVTRQRIDVAVAQSDGVAHPRIVNCLDAPVHVAHLAASQNASRALPTRCEHTDLQALVFTTRCCESNLVTLAHRAVDNSNEDYHTPVGVVTRIEHQRAQRQVHGQLWGRHLFDDRLQNLRDAETDLSRGGNCLCAVEPYGSLHLFSDSVRFSSRQIDLIQYRQNLEIVLNGQEHIRDSLRLYTLRRIDNKQGPLARLERARHLISKIDMARSVNEVEHVALAIACEVVHTSSLELDGDATLALEFHVVKKLLLHFSAGH